MAEQSLRACTPTPPRKARTQIWPGVRYSHCSGCKSASFAAMSGSGRYEEQYGAPQEAAPPQAPRARAFVVGEREAREEYLLLLCDSLRSPCHSASRACAPAACQYLGTPFSLGDSSALAKNSVVRRRCATPPPSSAGRCLGARVLVLFVNAISAVGRSQHAYAAATLSGLVLHPCLSVGGILGGKPRCLGAGTWLRERQRVA